MCFAGRISLVFFNSMNISQILILFIFIKKNLEKGLFCSNFTSSNFLR